MKSRFLTTAAIFAAATTLACSIPVLADDFGRDRDHGRDEHHRHPHDIHTETPIRHLVIIFNENRSFDHYFATYPNAANPSGSIPFVPKPHTPKVNNLANTRSQNHSYTPEQQAVDNGKEDLFPKFTGRGTAGGAGAFGTNGQVMGYFDGNTTTAFWNYAQHFAMSDNAWTDTFGPSTQGALAVISGQTNGAQNIVGTSASIADGQGGL